MAKKPKFEFSSCGQNKMKIYEGSCNNYVALGRGRRYKPDVGVTLCDRDRGFVDAYVRIGKISGRTFGPDLVSSFLLLKLVNVPVISID